VNRPAVPEPAIETIREAGLHYGTDRQAGIRRRPAGQGFAYSATDGRRIDRAARERIRQLVIPPAWTDVWISADPLSHLQATGRDAKGRKQYRYHAAWRAHRDETKFDRLQAFADVLPLIRRRTNADLEQPGLPRNKVLATIVQLLEKSLIRVGNEEYARHNQSFGLTTLRSRHVRVNGGTLRFQFRGKSGVRHSVSVNDRRLARVVKQCRDLPGQELFQYLDEAGEAQVVDSGDINGYLKEITGQDFTAKDFRTWSGTVLAATALREVPPPGTKRETERNNAGESDSKMISRMATEPDCREYQRRVRGQWNHDVSMSGGRHKSRILCVHPSYGSAHRCEET